MTEEVTSPPDAPAALQKAVVALATRHLTTAIGAALISHGVSDSEAHAIVDPLVQEAIGALLISTSVYWAWIVEKVRHADLKAWWRYVHGE